MIKMNLYMKIAERNITKKQLAEDTDIGKNTISLYCSNDYKKIDREHLDKFCKYFQCGINDIISYEYERRPYDVGHYRMFIESEIRSLTQRLTQLQNELKECNMIIHGQTSYEDSEAYNRHISSMSNEQYIQNMKNNYKPLNMMEGVGGEKLTEAVKSMSKVYKDNIDFEVDDTPIQVKQTIKLQNPEKGKHKSNLYIEPSERKIDDSFKEYIKLFISEQIAKSMDQVTEVIFNSPEVIETHSSETIERNKKLIEELLKDK